MQDYMENDWSWGGSKIRVKIHELKECKPKVIILLQFERGEATQADRGEATVYLDGQKTVVNFSSHGTKSSQRGARFIVDEHRKTEVNNGEER